MAATSAHSSHNFDSDQWFWNVGNMQRQLAALHIQAMMLRLGADLGVPAGRHPLVLTTEKIFNIGDILLQSLQAGLLSATRTKGTTIAAYTTAETIYLAADGRSISAAVADEERIVSGSGDKIGSINDHILAAVAGNAEVYGPMIRKVVTELGADDDIFKVKIVCDKYIEDWKAQPANKGKRIPITVFFCGFDVSGPVVISVGKREMVVREANVLNVGGSGRVWCLGYADPMLQGKNFKNDDDYFTPLDKGIVLSCIRNTGCGGIIKNALIRKGGEMEFFTVSHVLDVLFRHYGEFEKYLEKNLMCVTRGVEYSVQSETNLEKNIETKMIEFQLGKLKLFHVLGVMQSSNTIIRILEFPDIDTRNKANIILQDRMMHGNKNCEFYLPTVDVIGSVGADFMDLGDDCRDFL